MLSLIEAQQKIGEFTERLGACSIEINQACGHVLAEDIVSKIEVSPFRNSAMDGFAVSSEWLKDCSAGNPITLPVAATVYAGRGTSGVCATDLADRHAVKIMTGAPVPDQCDAVVKIEDVKSNEQDVTFCSAVSGGVNVRQPGEDIKRGAHLFTSGRTLSPLDIGILASLGIRRVRMYRRPTIKVITTGDELVEPGQALQPGEIYNSNKYTICSMLKSLSGGLNAAGVVGDTMEDLSAALDTCDDIIISTGGVSAGDKDYVIRAAESVGWQTVFHKVSIKPGKPFYFARRNSQLLFGLPGNPLSAAVTCAMFVVPALKKMMGRSDYHLQTVPVRLESGARKAGGRTLIWPGKIWCDGTEAHAAFSEKHSSAALTALLDSDGLIIQSAAENGNLEVSALTWEQIFK